MIPIESEEVEPTDAELAAIDNEWPVIAADLAVTNAECRHLLHASDLTHRAVRRAQRALAVAQRQAHNRSVNQTRGAS